MLYVTNINNKTIEVYHKSTETEARGTKLVTISARQHVRVPEYLAKHSATYPAESSCTHICWAETEVQVAIAAAATTAAGE